MNYAQSGILAMTFLIYGGLVVMLAVRMINSRSEGRLQPKAVLTNTRLVYRVLESPAPIQLRVRRRQDSCDFSLSDRRAA